MGKDTKKLNKFEKTRLLATRALELGDGSLPKTKLEKGKSYLTKDYVKVAMDELENGKLPLEIFKKEEE